MKKEYFINGWKYGKEYFYSIGNFTKNEIYLMEVEKEVITKNGNEFYINIED